ncbi:Alpha/Beta hydrolase protein [Plectosphaerella plurivora]|uniref:Kynurenine formamidase n=1 Tax=Plectosphaerella plurivora TaxID=936078 RepID=A0A9P9ABU9_9PEZI|nr:Alpha/Beta hydrolase protein [Plectosphaerella plurivora]
MDDASLSYTEHRYGDHDLQTVGVWELPDTAGTSVADGDWIIFIHGGAWRDPRKLHQGFLPSIRSLLASDSWPRLRPLVRGFASIDYRLSPHPEFPQDPASTPPSTYRDARHPDHILDVYAALSFLQTKYGFANRHILLGHSAGATMAYQLLMGSSALGSHAPPNIILPRAFIGISGIYELVGLDERHDGNYASFISAAFGDDRKAWNNSMPALFPGSFNTALGERRAVLAWSPDDTLVDEPEIDGMTRKLQQDGVSPTIIKTLNGDHDFVWEDGHQVARLIETVLLDL